jgi:hypothetical protein
MTDSKPFAEIWSHNFYSADENNWSHGRIMAVEDPTKPLHLKYDPLTKTAFVYNFDYYGWLKSVALAITGDMLEDAHQIYSAHGASLDIVGKGAALIAPSGTGKITHSWGMPRNPGVRLVAGDRFFVRLYDRSAVCYGSEKNCYVDADLGKIWIECREVLEHVVMDTHGRAGVNARWIVGAEGVVPMTTLKKVVLLKRDRADPTLLRQVADRGALGMLLEKEFYNPHQTPGSSNSGAGSSQIYSPKLTAMLQTPRRTPRLCRQRYSKPSQGNEPPTESLTGFLLNYEKKGHYR